MEKKFLQKKIMQKKSETRNFVFSQKWVKNIFLFRYLLI
jgi:hypothetical protein